MVERHGNGRTNTAVHGLHVRAKSSSALRRAALAATVVLAAPVAGSAAAAGGSNFCHSLRAVVADAPDAFEALRGAKVGHVPEDGGGDDETRYAATRTLPGARGCGVDRDRSDGEDLLSTYVCWFDPAAEGGLQVKRLAGEIAACLGRSPGDPLTLSVQSATADMHGKQFALSLGAPEQGGPIVLEIGQR